MVDFLVDPIISEDSISHEVNAVNNEYEMRIHNPHMKLFGVIQKIVNPNHEINRFFMGNNETLNAAPQRAGVKLRAELFRFFQEHYSAANMTAAFFGNLNMERF